MATRFFAIHSLGNQHDNMVSLLSYIARGSALLWQAAPDALRFRTPLMFSDLPIVTDALLKGAPDGEKSPQNHRITAQCGKTWTWESKTGVQDQPARPMSPCPHWRIALSEDRMLLFSVIEPSQG